MKKIGAFCIFVIYILEGYGVIKLVHGVKNSQDVGVLFYLMGLLILLYIILQSIVFLGPIAFLWLLGENYAKAHEDKEAKRRKASLNFAANHPEIFSEIKEYNSQKSLSKSSPHQNFSDNNHIFTPMSGTQYETGDIFGNSISTNYEGEKVYHTKDFLGNDVSKNYETGETWRAEEGVFGTKYVTNSVGTTLRETESFLGDKMYVNDKKGKSIVKQQTG